MKALVFNIRVNSLYSIRIPFTWQSALSYPILPPSAILGLLANALQRYKNDRHPLEYLAWVEDNVLWAGSKLLNSCIIKNYVTSVIIKWEENLGGKFTNALGRQYVYSKNLQVAVIFKDNTLINNVVEAIKTTPLTCGDSESPFSIVEEIVKKDVIEEHKEIIETSYPIPFTKNVKIIDGNGQVYLMHERCLRKENNFQLTRYMLPIIEENNIIKPSLLKIKNERERVLNIEDIEDIVYKME